VQLREGTLPRCFQCSVLLKLYECSQLTGNRMSSVFANKYIRLTGQAFADAIAATRVAEVVMADNWWTSKGFHEYSRILLRRSASLTPNVQVLVAGIVDSRNQIELLKVHDATLSAQSARIQERYGLSTYVKGGHSIIVGPSSLRNRIIDPVDLLDGSAADAAGTEYCRNKAAGCVPRNIVLDKNKTCPACEHTLCGKCWTMYPTAAHECTDADLALAESTRKLYKPCPSCRSPIEKAEGCDQIFCVVCKSAWDWRTFRPLSLSAIHNPHLEQWRLHRGQTDNCGRPRTSHSDFVAAKVWPGHTCVVETQILETLLDLQTAIAQHQTKHIQEQDMYRGMYRLAQFNLDSTDRLPLQPPSKRFAVLLASDTVNEETAAAQMFALYEQAVFDMFLLRHLTVLLTCIETILTQYLEDLMAGTAAAAGSGTSGAGGATAGPAGIVPFHPVRVAALTAMEWFRDAMADCKVLTPERIRDCMSKFDRHRKTATRKDLIYALVSQDTTYLADRQLA
jgi:hypothetical protein